MGIKLDEINKIIAFNDAEDYEFTLNSGIEIFGIEVDHAYQCIRIQTEDEYWG